jgi:hypothetical protein
LTFVGIEEAWLGRLEDGVLEGLKSRRTGMEKQQGL